MPKAWGISGWKSMVGPIVGGLAVISWAARSLIIGLLTFHFYSKKFVCTDCGVFRFDASEFIIEHYTDGDVVNCNTPPSREKASKHSLYAWGPNVPLEIMKARTAADWDKIPVVARGLVSAEV